MDLLVNYQYIIRPTVFIMLFALLAIAEYSAPLAPRKSSRIKQWSINLTLSFLSNFSLKLFLPILALGAASYANELQIGLFNWIELPVSVSIVTSLLLLDFIIYWQHRLFHQIPLLWSLHRLHHTELGLDVSSAVRFHPIEIIISMLIKITFVVLLGVPVVAVILFELLLNAFALFNHSNLKLAHCVDSGLRKLIVTPEVHWIHHSPDVKETNSNYGFNLIVWDKLFSTYVAKPQIGYFKMQQGLREFGLIKPLSLIQLILLPFMRQKK